MLRSQFLGGTRLFVNDIATDRLANSKALELISFLLLNPDRKFSRQLTAETIWGERRTGDVMKMLRQELWILRRTFRDLGFDLADYLFLNGSELGVNGNPEIDALIFERSIDSILAADAGSLNAGSAAMLEAEVRRYAGDLLPGVYNDWCVLPREVLRDKYIMAVEKLMLWHAASGDWGTALINGKRLLGVDPMLEHVHRAMMHFHYARGDRPAALRQYVKCRDTLRKELMIEPMSDTVGLYEAIRREDRPEIARKAVRLLHGPDHVRDEPDLAGVRRGSRQDHLGSQDAELPF